MAGLIPRRKSALAEINVVPLVDIMLVLLIIFMITAPLMQQGIDVNLPKAKGKSIEEAEKINIVVTKEGKIYVNEKLSKMQELQSILSAFKDSNIAVLLKADKDVPYGLVAEVMGEIKASGIERIGMITEPKENQ
ncbi:MAG: ExbD/TolR family protein [Thermodesulfovibrio sp.]|uniref:ExbD/TolR family protein n=1 Tax=unclassified Thermodesulfovibrio TaxID=2645936 RepID=UPI00083B5444|nr:MULTISPECIES: ExbD/TolR family protein [unclassified Thermodesulfovibrio]MDI1472122.1 ExbD/TolR family protein [Thermodesulfovibrio sp. 1176]MDI6714919.1 ExbD/TolR family protein [Thermodesulfovibrio sp.]ODA43265.1 Biopolymer transport protein ExbD/TolR [Thermodesulfovibrio sp. N1]